MSVEKKETLIQVQNLTKTFGGSVHALNGVSTDIKKGEVVCVIGPSGSGKSTFLRCLNRLEDPTDGRIIFAGEDLMDPKTDIDNAPSENGNGISAFQPVSAYVDPEKYDDRPDETAENAAKTKQKVRL